MSLPVENDAPPRRWDLHPIAPNYVEYQITALLYDRLFKEAAWLARELWDWANDVARVRSGDRLATETREFWRGMWTVTTAIANRYEIDLEAKRRKRRQKKVNA